MTLRGVTMQATLSKIFWDGDKRNYQPILLAPKDFDDRSRMTHMTEQALFAAKGVPIRTKIDGVMTVVDHKIAKQKFGASITCEDIEGSVSKF